MRFRIPNFRNFAVLFFVISIFSSRLAYSGGLNSPDSIPSKKIKPKFVLLLDIRNSFIKKSEVTIYGAAAGVSFNKKHQFTLGFYFLSEEGQRVVRTKTEELVNISFELDLKFASLGYTYTFPVLKFLDISIPLEIGFGISKTTPRNTSGTIIRKPLRSVFIPVQTGLKADVKLTRWVGINGSVGYRETLTKGDFKQDYDGMYYHYGLSIYFSNILEDIKKKK